VTQGAPRFGITLALALCSICIPAEAGPVNVLSVGDGDTITVSEGGRRVTVRLACIDAPETAQSPFGGMARSALQSLVPVGTSVTIQGRKKDRYGRTVSEVYRGNTNVNLELVRRGQAFAYRQYLQGCDREAYLKAERRAEASRTGVWSVPGGVIRPWVWRKRRTSPAASKAEPRPTSSRYRCSDQGSWAKAQEYLKQGHTYLDADRDGEACESLR